MVKILVMRDNIKVNTKDDHGRSPLSYAAEHVNQAVVKILVAWDDVEVDTKDDHGRLPLSYAAEHGIRWWWRSLLRGTTLRWTPSTTQTTGMVVCHCLTLPNMGVRRGEDACLKCCAGFGRQGGYQGQVKFHTVCNILLYLIMYYIARPPFP